MVVNGRLSKTAVNGAAGARSQLSGLLVAALTIVTLLFLTGLFEDLPEATLAAIVIAAVAELVDVPSLVRLYHLHTSGLARIYGAAARADFIAAAAALFGVLIFDTLPGLFIGISSSLLLLLYRSSRPNVAVLGLVPGTRGDFGDVERQPPKQTLPGIVILRVEAGLFFANADAVRERLLAAVAAPDTRSIVLDCETVPFIDVTAAGMLAELADELEGRHIELVLARDVGQVRDILRQADTTGIRAYATVEAAVEAVSQSAESSAGA